MGLLKAGATVHERRLSKGCLLVCVGGGVCGNDTGEVGASRELIIMGDVSAWLGKQCGFQTVG